MISREEAENYFYKSYLKAEPHLNYDEDDSYKRHPELTRELIRKESNSTNIAVTGSKGKGSVSAMIAAILGMSLKVGLMTSPHIEKFNERFRVNGAMISDQELAAFVEQLQSEIEAIDRRIPVDQYVSPMGIQALLALRYFKEKATDVNVFEYGKGALYDDTNNILHQYAVINTIFLEHTRELGKTLKDIAENKAAIMTGEQRYVYSAQQEEEVLKVLEKCAAEKACQLKVYGREFYAHDIIFDEKGMRFNVTIEDVVYRDIQIPLLGEHQAGNCALAMAVCRDILPEFDIEVIKTGLSAMQWPGRLEIISKEPLVILDACINRASAQMVTEVLKKMNIPKATAIVGIPDDKDYAGVVETVRSAAERIILTKSSNPHYRFTDVQMETLKESGIDVQTSDCFREAYEKSLSYHMPIVILGTTSLISDVKKMFY